MLLLLLLMPTVCASLAEGAEEEGSGVKRYVVFYDAQMPEVAQTLDTLREFMIYSSWQCSYVDVWMRHCGMMTSMPLWFALERNRDCRVNLLSCSEARMCRCF